MPFTLKMPKLSPTMEEGSIVKWKVKEKDFVKAGDVLLEVATDKATVEHTALDKGYLRKILVQEGESALVNQPIAIFTLKLEESIEGYQPEGILPEVKKEEVSVSTKVATASETVGKTVPGGLSQPQFQPEPPLQDYDFSSFYPNTKENIHASPYAKKLAEEQGIDIDTVAGSGPHGRILARDIEKGQKKGIVSFGKREIPQLLPGSYEEEKLTPMRKIIAQRLQESKTFIPHFYVSQNIEVSSLCQIREELKTHEIKLSVNDFVIRAAALSLREHPLINSGFNSVNQTIIRFKTIDIAVAVSVESGLITPIVRHADFRNISEISREIKLLAAKAKAGKLQKEEYKGGSFTVSNLGMYGVSSFAGIINPPQAAILCVAGIEEGVNLKGGQVISTKKMSLTLCADHRVIDGADAAKFLVSIKKLLETPSLLLVN